jgi:protein-tyrosine-phosphatase
MPIHFAAARSAARSPVARALARKAIRRAANDNPGGAGEQAGDPMLHAALRHFGEHGLNAAGEAAALAERAWRIGDMDACHWWMGICSKLDRKLSRDLLRRIGTQDVG